MPATKEQLATLTALSDKVIAGQELKAQEREFLLNFPDVKALMAAAAAIRAHCALQKLDCCAVLSVKSGRCSEDCHWCAQSAHYHTGAEIYPLLDKVQCLKVAQEAERRGIKRFSLVSAGRKPKAQDFARLVDIVRLLKAQTTLYLCASLGLVTVAQLQELKQAGLQCVHCNLETAPSFFAKVCTTHTQEDKLQVIKAARQVGLDVCVGGIIGLGESRAQRMELALTLKALGITSVPLNILHPIAGTPLGNRPHLDEAEVLRTIALWRFILPTAYIRLAGGQALLSPATLQQAFDSGLNAAIVGNLLTTPGAQYVAAKFALV